MWRDAPRRKQKQIGSCYSFVGTYGPLFDVARGGARWWPALEWTVGVLSAVLCGSLVWSTRPAWCLTVVALVGIGTALLVVLVLWKQCLDARIDVIQSVSSNVLATASTVLVLVEAIALIRRRDEVGGGSEEEGEGGESSSSVASAAVVFLWMQVAVSTAALLLTVISFVYELGSAAAEELEERGSSSSATTGAAPDGRWLSQATKSQRLVRYVMQKLLSRLQQPTTESHPYEDERNDDDEEELRTVRRGSRRRPLQARPLVQSEMAAAKNDHNNASGSTIDEEEGETEERRHRRGRPLLSSSAAVEHNHVDVGKQSRSPTSSQRWKTSLCSGTNNSTQQGSLQPRRHLFEEPLQQRLIVPFLDNEEKETQSASCPSPNPRLDRPHFTPSPQQQQHLERLRLIVQRICEKQRRRWVIKNQTNKAEQMSTQIRTNEMKRDDPS